MNSRYYARPFVPPQEGILKGVVNLGEVVDVNAFGCRLELHIAKGRSVFKLVADTEKIARDWAALIKMEAHLSGLDNPLNKAVQESCRKFLSPVYTSSFLWFVLPEN